MQYSFDQRLDRENTDSVKYDGRGSVFKNKEIMPLWVADMDFKTPDFIVEAMKKRLEHPIFGYSFRPKGIHQCIVDWMQKQHQWKIRGSWISYCPGVVPALNFAMMAYTNPGDEVIVQPPVYYPFFSAVKNHGCKIVYNQLMEKEGRYFFDLDDLEQKISAETKMIFLCSPHNPGGRVWSREELTALGDICIKHNLIVVADEIHADIVFKGHRHIPFASVKEEFAERTVTLNAPSKTFNFAGLSISYAIISDKSLQKSFNEAMEKVHLENPGLFGAIAMKAAYEHGTPWLNELLEYLEGNIQFLKAFIDEEMPAVRYVIPDATFLIWLDFRSLGMDDNALKDWMVNEAGVGMNPGVMFGPGGEGFLRINIACQRDYLEKALGKIAYAVRKKHG